MNNTVNTEVKDETPSNAIDFIKSSNFFSEPKYSWVLPLINKVLTDELEDSDIDALLKTSDATVTEGQTVTKVIRKEMTYAVEPRDIRSISEISSITNVGLVDTTEPVKLEAGLNIFYGKNGAGKSSVYHALCSLFGKDKKVHPNLEAQDADTSCVIKYKNQTDVETELQWSMGTVNPNSATMIFDGQIAQVLVDNDQDNKFEIAHLKLEYFSYLHSLYEKVESGLKSNFSNAKAQIDAMEYANRSDLEFLFTNSIDELVRTATEVPTVTEETRLAEIEKTLQTLGKDNPEAVVKNLNSVQAKIIEVLQTFGSKDIASGEWQLKHTQEKLVTLSERIRIFNETKKTFEEGGISKLSKIVPSDWVQNQLWNAFIAKSIEFTESLETASKHKYTNDNCVYCQQKLDSADAKKLIEAYHEITTEHKTKLQEEKLALEGIVNIIENNYISKLATLATTNALIEPELDDVQKKALLEVDSTTVTAIYTGIKESVATLTAIDVTKDSVAVLTSFYSTYKELSSLFMTKIAELNTAVASREDTIKKLTDEASPLRRKSLIKKHASVITKYIDQKKILRDAEEKNAHIHLLKQSTSSQETSFAKVASLKEFKTYLDAEYKGFNFVPPSSWNLKPTTKDGINKRNYSLADKKLADIFSEGERKLHALADFFAQCEINKYKGVYIFDDPVNSLDSDNIERVAKRILELVEAGNQVIVFTHNLQFLYALGSGTEQKVHKVTKIPSTKQISIVNTKLDTTSSLSGTMKDLEVGIKILTTAGVATTSEIGAMYDLMSNYIEDYTEKILFNGVVTRYRPNIRMTSLSTLPTITPEKIQIITELYERTSRNGNRHSNPEDIPEPTLAELTVDFQTLTTELNYK